MSRKPKILLLQGPVGPFFDELSKAFEKSGCVIRRVIFNGGDWFYSSGPNRLLYRNGESGWRSFIDNLTDGFQPDVAILFGDERPIHKIAIDTFKQKGIEYWCFEEGYIRPNYVTFERVGNNANSNLRARGAEDLKNIISFSKFSNSNSNSNSKNNIELHVNGISRFFLGNVFVYFAVKKLLEIFFINYIHHREYKITEFLTDYFRWKWLSKKFQWNAPSVEEKIRHGNLKKYFIVLLQVQEDLQLLAHGMGWNNRNVIENIIASFSRCANSETKLLFKLHPLNLKYYRDYNLIKALAFRYGVEDRVTVINLSRNKVLLKNCIAALTINSTAGIEALKHSKNIFTFGLSIYDVFAWPKSTDTIGDLNKFWSLAAEREVTDWGIIENYIMNSLLAGDFYDKSSYEYLIESILFKLGIGDNHDQNIPQQTQELIISNENI